jgi:hypothetical protein
MVTESELMAVLRSNPPANRFVPYCHLNRDSDTLTVYFEGDADYSECLTDHMTLYRSLETREVVGCRINGISGLVDDLPNYIRVNHGGIDLSVIFFAFRGDADDSATTAINELSRAASEKNLVLDQCA